MRVPLIASDVGTLKGTHHRRHMAVAARVRGAGWQAQDGLHSSKGKVINLTQVMALVARSSMDLGTDKEQVSNLPS